MTLILLPSPLLIRFPGESRIPAQTRENDQTGLSDSPTVTITVDIIEPTGDCSSGVPVPTDCTTQTITEPGPTETITEPGPTATITEPGETETITEPGQTETITEPGQTETITEPPVTETETETVTDTDIITQSVTVTQTTTQVTTTTTTFCPTDTPTGGPDTGDCTPPTISYYPDRDPNEAFEIDDSDIYEHGPTALISTLTSHICNQLRSPCNAPEETVAYCWNAAELVDESGLEGEEQASYWNSFWT